MTVHERDVLFEIIETSRPLDEALRKWLADRTVAHRSLPGIESVDVWEAISDDTGPLGTGVARMLLVHHVTPPALGEVEETVRRETAAPCGATVAWYASRAISYRRLSDRLDPQHATGLRFVAMNSADGNEEEFHSWYEEDHLPRFANVPGVLLGRRFRSPGSPREYLAVYWLASIEVVNDPRWRAAADTEWTRTMRAKTFDRDRINFIRYLPR